MPKINRKLTEVEIRNAKPKAKPYRLYDEGDLRLLIRPSGTKVWQYRYIHDGKENIFTIGAYGQGHGQVGAAEARQACAAAKALHKQGIDPNQHKKSRKHQAVLENKNTFELIARDWYCKQTWAPKHAKNIMSRLENDVFLQIGWKPIAEINVRDVMAVLKRIEERGALDVAKRINQYCTAIFEHAILQGLCDTNPAMGRAKFVKSYKPQNRSHLTERELPSFIKKLNEANPSSQSVLAVKLLALTFVRPGELRGALWEEIDVEKALWTIPASRMKMEREHLVPLSKQALAVIQKLRDINGDRIHLFPGNKNKPISDVTLIKAVKKYTGGKATPHGFRHTASTILNEKGFNHDHIERQLAHIESNKVRGAYNKALYLEDRRNMMQLWADYLEELNFHN